MACDSLLGPSKGCERMGVARRSSSGSSADPAPSGRSGRAIDIGNRRTPQPRADDYVFEGYEMGDALSAANTALRDDLEVSAEEGVDTKVPLFEEDELLKPLERWFFGHKP